MTTEKIERTRFPAGATVPDWLIVAEPATPDAVNGALTFGPPVEVLELADEYVVIPTLYGPIPPLINFAGHGCRIFASNKVVRAVTGMGSFQTANVDFYGGNQGIVGAAPLPAEPPRRTLAQRIYDLFKP